MATLFLTLKFLKKTMQTSTTAMNASLHALGGTPASDYMAGEVAWNDGSRGVVKKQLSVFSNNMTDSRIIAEDGGHVPFVRPNNLDEKLGVTNASNIMMTDNDGLQITAQDVLDKIAERAKYMGYTDVNVNLAPNHKVVYRVQNAWVPLKKGQVKRRIAPAHYSYQTRTRSNPRNLIVLGTGQGIHVHSDDAGVNKLLAHSVLSDGTVNTHWFEAEASDTRVGQSTSAADVMKKARANEMGIKGMGPRANCFIVMSIPNKQSETYDSMAYDDDDDNDMPLYRSCNGISRAANITTATEVAGTAELNAVSITRPEEEPIVVTFLLYNTVQLPDDAADLSSVNIKTTDIALAVSDMEHIYDLARVNGGDTSCLSKLPVMLHSLTKNDVNTIVAKVTHDPSNKAEKKSFVPVSDALAMF